MSSFSQRIFLLSKKPIIEFLRLLTGPFGQKQPVFPLFGGEGDFLLLLNVIAKRVGKDSDLLAPGQIIQIKKQVFPQA